MVSWNIKQKKVWSLLATEKTMLLHGDVIIKLVLVLKVTQNQQQFAYTISDYYRYRLHDV